jgi:UPF0271 protein
MKIDLNADVGEGFDDEPLYGVVSSVNIACGAHAGDDTSMTRAIETALTRGVAIGAHPGYPDREHFGRRSLDMNSAALRATILDQIDALSSIAEPLGARVTHMKPHGALYNKAAVDEELAALLADCARERGLVYVGLANSAMTRAGARAEGFADRAYTPEHTLVPRDVAGAVIHDPDAAAAQAVALARSGRCATLCVHGDTPGALEIARAVRAALTGAGIEIAAAD